MFMLFFFQILCLLQINKLNFSRRSSLPIGAKKQVAVPIFYFVRIIKFKNKMVMEGTKEYKLMNASLMRKYPNVPGRVYVKVFDTLSGGKQVIS